MLQYVEVKCGNGGVPGRDVYNRLVNNHTKLAMLIFWGTISPFCDGSERRISQNGELT